MFGIGFNPLTYLAGGITLVLLLALGAQTFRLSLAQRDVAIAKQHQAEAETIGAKVNEIFAREEATRERHRAEAEAKFASEQSLLRADRDAIETRYKNASAERSKLSAENRRLIANAPKTDSRELGPTMLSYFDRLRGQQQARRSSGVAPAPGN